MKDNHLLNGDNKTYMDVPVSDVVLTPLTCASLVNEILKGLLYQKCQIPYPYSWLQKKVTKKRQLSNSNDGRPNLNIANHFRVVSLAYDNLENIMKAVVEEFAKDREQVEEVLIVFGTTPHSPKEVVTIKVSEVARGHIERNHIAHIIKYQQKILRTIFLSQSWLDSIDTNMTCTNIYIFLKKWQSEPVRTCDKENLFVPTRPLTFPAKLKQVKINLCSENNANSNCCDNLLVYGDNRVSIESNSDESSEQHVVWYQFKDLVKGFKDCYVNKVSASELW